MIRRHALVAAGNAIGRLLVATVLCASILLLTSEAFAAAFVAQAVKTRGDIRITRDGGEMSCSQGTAVQLGDIIKTGPGARLRLRFTDGSIIALGENTRLSVDLFAVDAANKSRTVVLTVLEGIVNAAAAKSGESKFDYQIKTASGYSAVRGTKWIVAFQQALMTVYVLNGIVEMGGFGNQPPVTINQGQWGAIDAAGTPSPPQPTTQEQLQPVLDATSDTAMNSAPPSSVPGVTPNTVPPLIPVPTLTPPPTNQPPTRAEKGDKSGGGNRGGRDHGMTGN